MAHIFIKAPGISMKNVLRAMLEYLGHTVQTASDRVHAVELIPDIHFDLAVVDVDMPDMTGLELITTLNKKRPELKILAISDGRHLKEAMRLGAASYLLKPFRLDELSSGTNALLSEKLTFSELQDFSDDLKGS